MAIRDKRILVTGASGQIAFPLVQELAKENEVWALARFANATGPTDGTVRASRHALEESGVIPRSVDLTKPDWSRLPEHFDHVLHLAVFQEPGLDFDYALQVNAEGTGLLMARFRNATSFLVLSTMGVYATPADPTHRVSESDPLADQVPPHSPTYSISKICQEAVARTMARTLGLSTTIARMGLSYGANGGLPAYQLEVLLSGQTIQLTEGRTYCNPIFQSDINAQATRLLEVAAVPATIVNWAGDEVVRMEEYLLYLGELTATKAEITYTSAFTPAASGATITDQAKRRTLIGECSVGWREGMRRMLTARHPDRVRG